MTDELPVNPYMATSEPWMADAACTGLTHLMFPGRGNNQGIRIAKAICAGCTVVDDCREFAVRTNEKDGIWGGLSGRERRRLRHDAVVSGTVVRLRPGPIPGQVRTPINHGTSAGYQKHLRYGEPICRSCREAHNADQAKRRAMREGRVA